MTSRDAPRFAILVLVLVAAAGAAGAATVGPEHDLEIAAVSPPSTMETAVQLSLDVEVSNRGRGTWSAEDGFALAYHWFHEDGSMAVLDGRRTPLVEPIGPGESRVVRAVLRAPDVAGGYLLQWDVVHEGVLWITESDTTPPALVPVTVAASHAFTILEGRAPRFLSADGSTTVEVVLRNEGLRTWLGDQSVSLAYHWLDVSGEPVEWEGHRTAVVFPVRPGETVALDAFVAAPAAPGRYRLKWDMVEEGVCWFSDRSVAPDASTVVVTPPSTTLLGWAWAGLVAVAAIVLFVRGRRRGLDGGCSVADVGWCLGALTLKPAWLLYVAGSGLSASGWCFTVASALAVGALLLLVGRRLRPWISWLVVAVTTTVVFIDSVHTRFFGDLASVAALRSAAQVGRVEESVRSLLEVGDVWLWAELAAGLFLVAAVARFRSDGPVRRRAAVWAASAAAVLALAGLVVVDRSISFRQVFHATQLARHVGVLNLHAADVGGSLLRAVRRPDLDAAALAEVEEYFKETRTRRAGTGPLFGAARGRNLVMIQVESLQAFVVGLRVDGAEVTPYLNAMARESFVFGDATDQTEEGRSSDAELATQVSLLPPDRGAAAFLYSGNHYTGLASILAGRGYATLSAVPFDGAFWNRRVTHRAYGYEQSLFTGDFGPGKAVGWGLNDRDFLVQAAGRLAELREPWCAYLLTLSLHHPFEGFPEELKRLDVGRWEGTPYGNFLHTMHHFDQALAGFVEEIEAAGLTDNTVLALWGDHDAGFEWRPEIADAMGFTADPTGWYLSQRVPFIVRVPGVSAPVELEPIPAGHSDAAPTLLALLGVDPAPYAFTGRNLLGVPGDGPVVGEYRGWHDATHVYLRRGPRLGDGQCIDLTTRIEVDAEACGVGFEAARRQVEISRKVLEYDLQRRLRDDPVR